MHIDKWLSPIPLTLNNAYNITYATLHNETDILALIQYNHIKKPSSLYALSHRFLAFFMNIAEVILHGQYNVT